MHTLPGCSFDLMVIGVVACEGVCDHLAVLWKQASVPSLTLSVCHQ